MTMTTKQKTHKQNGNNKTRKNEGGATNKLKKYKFRIDPSLYKKNSKTYLKYKDATYKIGNYSYTFNDLCCKTNKKVELVFINNYNSINEYYHYDRMYNRKKYIDELYKVYTDTDRGNNYDLSIYLADNSKNIYWAEDLTILSMNYYNQSQSDKKNKEIIKEEKNDLINAKDYDKMFDGFSYSNFDDYDGYKAPEYDSYNGSSGGSSSSNDSSSDSNREISNEEMEEVIKEENKSRYILCAIEKKPKKYWFFPPKIKDSPKSSNPSSKDENDLWGK